MQNRRPRALVSIAIIFLVIANGWHLGFLQVFALSNMAWNNAGEMAIDDAILKAIDGTEICGICQIVIKATGVDGDQDLQTIEIVTKSLLLLENGELAISGPQLQRGNPKPHYRQWDPWLPQKHSPPPRA